MIVCDSGPLIALGGVDRLDLLNELFGRVCAPEEVFAEWREGGLRQTGLEALNRASWIELVSMPDPCEPLLAALLDLGEARAIQLARQLDTAALLMDEARGRRIAREIFQLRVIGTGRVLVEAKRRGLIPKVAPLIDEIREGGYWLSDKIVAEILRQSGE